MGMYMRLTRHKATGHIFSSVRIFSSLLFRPAKTPHLIVSLGLLVRLRYTGEIYCKWLSLFLSPPSL